MKRAKQLPKAFVTVGILTSVTVLLTLGLVVAIVYAKSGTNHNVQWSVSVGSLAYSGATQETDSAHAYSVQNNREAPILLGWEFSHVILDPDGIEVHSATKHDEGSLIEISSGGFYSDSTLIRTAVDHLMEMDDDYMLKAYTEIRINPEQGAQLFARKDEKELPFMR